MKKILIKLSLISLVSIPFFGVASAQYYSNTNSYPSGYNQNYNYQNSNYHQNTNYGQHSYTYISGCYTLYYNGQTRTNSVVSYNCQSNYTYTQPTYSYYTYPTYYTTPSYYTYQYSNGSWYPEYGNQGYTYGSNYYDSSYYNNGHTNTGYNNYNYGSNYGSNYGNSCYYQNGYHVCY